ncbi:uncharacterized protein ATNIH1004_010992 [Aspergillus tanneri]|uniref:Ketoreductase (KR) domain-containing protein n=1 Tax=Aspergillus tanneri TaxID=1220188 RepID=A0A5M9M4W5_9EURO|nr:uncharacterized protein ATNIH1004_010992 [Aspergillus tanneri]KAA8642052.1 hypothetical protein ATNIH1004_010992 [Aspergillus tanneri]
MKHPALSNPLSLSRPELHQTGKIVLVTGRGTSIGFHIVKSFILAGVARAILVGRREVRETAARDSPPWRSPRTSNETQTVSFHPESIHNQEFEKMGISETGLPFDDPAFPGAFAVWATTLEARFLHGRFVWASWDIDEYSPGEIRKRIEENVDFLRVGVVGLKGASRGW